VVLVATLRGRCESRPPAPASDKVVGLVYVAGVVPEESER